MPAINNFNIPAFFKYSEIAEGPVRDNSNETFFYYSHVVILISN